VQVNIIYDSLGSLRSSGSFFRRLRKGGVNVLEFSPLNPFRARGLWHPIYRDHRKVLIVDGKTAVTGGINISSEFPGSRAAEKKKVWRDTDIEIKGPAVAEFQRLFLDTWKRQTGPKLPRRDYFPPLKSEGDDLVRVAGSTPGDWNRITFIMYVSAFNSARKSIHLTNAYFVPDNQIVNALTGAAKRGVDVKIILPDSSDFNMIFYAGRHYYSELLKAGVKLYERQKHFLHAKTAVIDGVWSTVGSTNMDYWSSAHNDEENAVVVGRDFASQMEAMFSEDLAESKEILPGEWEKRSSIAKFREWFFHLFAPAL
jgi:cardiolipin synthase